MYASSKQLVLHVIFSGYLIARAALTVFNGSYADIQCRAAEFMEYLSMGFEQNAFWEARARGEDYQIHPIVKEEALTLDNDTFNKLFAEAQTEWVKDGTTVKGNTTGKKTDSQ